MPFQTHTLPRHRLLGRLAWLLPLCGLLALALTWWLLLSTLKAEQVQAREAALQQVRGLGKAFEAHTRNALRQVDQTTRVVAYSYQQQGKAFDLDALVQQAGQFTPGLTGVHVADQNGNVMTSTLSGPVVNIADREHFRVHVDGRFNGMFISKPLLGRLSGRWSIQMTRRIESVDGRFLGVVIVSADPAYFTDFYSEQQFGRHGLLSFVGLDGVVRGRRIGDKVWFDDTNSVSELPQALRKSHDGVLDEVSRIDGHRRWLAYAQLPGYPIVVLTGLDEREALEGHNARRATVLRLLGLGTGVTLLFLGGLGWLLRRLHDSQAEAATARLQLEAAADASLDAFYILRAERDAAGRIEDFRFTHCNARGAALLAMRKEEVAGQRLLQLLPVNEDERFFPRYCRVVETGLPLEDEFLIDAPSAPGLWLQHQVVRVGDGIAITTRDVTLARQRQAQADEAQMQREASERRLRLIADNVPALISHLDAQGRYLYANQQFERLLGLDPARLAGRPLTQVRDEAYVAQVTSAMQTVLGGHEVTFETELSIKGAARRFQQHYVPDVDAQGRVGGFFSITFDVTELKDIERRLSVMARTDTLTGLPNRLHFHEKLTEAQARQRRSGNALALLYLDVDRFKRINDVHGHAMGDAVLKEFAVRLRASVRETDTVARLAGDEFVVILEGVHAPADAKQVARKILAAFEPPFEMGGGPLPVGTSIGIVVDQQGARAPDELLAAADDALYQAKRMGRRRAQLWQGAAEPMGA
jgi:diguanylate cyclase (GGDEF)-like protein/PAS domain S-box-containing protein